MRNDNTLLVTGANGFVGRALCEALAAAGREIRMAVRTARPECPGAVEVGDIGPDTEWRAALEGVECVVHLAARTHVLRESASDPLAEYRRVNVEGTRRLAGEAARAGVRRLVFVSSIKVNGESTQSRPFTEDDAPRPEDAYGVTKWEAEQALARVARESGIAYAVLRPPLVYGPGVKGNFLRLMDIVARGLPLPLGAIENRRSLIYVGNLADAIVRLTEAPGAAGRAWLVADGEDLSTPQLVRAIARACRVVPRLVACPPLLLRFAAAAAGRSADYARLAGSLQVDSSRIRGALGWQPRHTLEQGLEQTARWYYAQSSARAL